MIRYSTYKKANFGILKTIIQNALEKLESTC